MVIRSDLLENVEPICVESFSQTILVEINDYIGRYRSNSFHAP